MPGRISQQLQSQALNKTSIEILAPLAIRLNRLNFIKPQFSHMQI